MNVVQMRTHNLQDIPAMLRQLADSIEGGAEPAQQAVVALVGPEGAVKVYGYGDIGPAHETIGVLQVAVATLVNGAMQP